MSHKNTSYLIKDASKIQEQQTIMSIENVTASFISTFRELNNTALINMFLPKELTQTDFHIHIQSKIHTHINEDKISLPKKSTNV